MKKPLLFLTLILAVSMSAQTNFNATEDVYVQGGTNASVNYNNDGGSESAILEIKIGGNEDFFRRTFVKFNLTAAGLAGADVDNATLRLRVADVQKPTADPATITVSGTTDGWAEGTVTYSDAPASGTALSSVVGITGTDRPTEDGGADGEDKYWDVTSFVKTELDGDKIVSFVLEDLGAANNTVTFSSKAGANAPTLIINDPSLSISSFDAKEKAISLNQNPVSDVLGIKVANGELSKVTIFDITGKALYVNDAAEISNQINVNWLNTGLYLLKAETETGTQSLKFIKK